MARRTKSSRKRRAAGAPMRSRAADVFARAKVGRGLAVLALLGASALGLGVGVSQLEARAAALIDVSHWASEWLWLDAAAAELRDAHPDLEWAVSALRTGPWDFQVLQCPVPPPTPRHPTTYVKTLRPAVAPPPCSSAPLAPLRNEPTIRSAPPSCSTDAR